MLSNNNIKLLYGKNGLLLNIENNWKPNIIRKPIMPIIENIPKKLKKYLANQLTLKAYMKFVRIQNQHVFLYVT